MSDAAPEDPQKRSLTDRFLNAVEWAGNKLPDPAVLFLLALFITWGLSAILAQFAFSAIDPRTNAPIEIHNQLAGPAMMTFLTGMVETFTSFHPLGVVLVALLGVGVAEHTGFINAVIKSLLSITPLRLLTPMLLFVAIISHSAGDAGYVLVIPLGGIIFAAAGRHPVAGIVCAFAGVSGGFSANFLPSALDPLLQGLTQEGARVIDPERTVNPLCNWYFTSASCLLIIGVGWYLTDRVIEPRLRRVAVDGNPDEVPKIEAITPSERRGMIAGLLSIVASLMLLAAACMPEDSPFRDPERGTITGPKAPLMQSIVPLIFLLFLIPGIVHGYVAGTVKSHRDIIQGMSKSMSTMGYYIVLAFFAAQFTNAFKVSNLGALLAIEGANFLQWLEVPAGTTIVGIIILAAIVNLLIGSASGKWALLAPIFVPMLMQVGLSPELTQAAYRVGDSSTNIITPLMPYFPLIVVYCQRYVKNTGIGTLVSLMLPYSMCFFLTWITLLLVYWQILGWPLGLDAPYTYVPAT